MGGKVPNRFLGYAFCVGDLLMELDQDFNIVNADGAVKNTIGAATGSGAGSNFIDLLETKGRGLFKKSIEQLTGANRIGPLMLNVGRSDHMRELYGAFVAKLPNNPGAIFVVLSRPQRLGLNPDGSKKTLTTDQKKQGFFSALEDLFDQDPSLEDKVQVTVLDTGAVPELSSSQQNSIEAYLQSLSYGGNTASRVADDKFALVHERENEEASGASLKAAIAQKTGAEVTTATIDAREANLSQKDNMRALVFSLQQFTEDSEGFDAESIQKNCQTLIGETTERVKAFRKVLDDGAFSLVYQPIVHMKKGTTHHFEALTRFDLPDIMKSQWEMIRFAEDVGLIDDFDKAVVQRAIGKIRELIRQGGSPGIAVNLSGRSLSNPEFVLHLVSTLKGNTDLKKYLSLEITESARIEDLDALAEVVQEIRSVGFKVYLDDFGAGAAGFQYLKSLKVDAVKIDGAYIKDAINSSEDRAFLRSMVGLCKDLGITTVGEWVETKDHADLLAELGVDYGQGYYYGKPTNGLIAARVGKAAAAE